MALSITNISDDDGDTIYTTSGLAGPSLTVSPTTYGTVGSVLSTSLNGNLSWNNSMPYSYGYNDTITITQPASKTLRVDGDAEITGDLKLNGINLSERLVKIEERLGILRPNNDLENRWEKLKALGEEYRRLEKEILEGESIWDTLKK